MIKKKQKEKFLESLENGSNISLACKKSNIARATIYRHIANNAEFEEEVERALTMGNSYIADMAESKLMQNINSNHFPAIKFALESIHPKYKRRSYYERGKKEEVVGLTAQDKREMDEFLDSMFETMSEPIEDVWTQNKTKGKDQKDQLLEK